MLGERAKVGVKGYRQGDNLGKASNKCLVSDLKLFLKKEVIIGVKR
jgi:hypothetical protein